MQELDELDRARDVAGLAGNLNELNELFVDGELARLDSVGRKVIVEGVEEGLCMQEAALDAFFVLGRLAEREADVEFLDERAGEPWVLLVALYSRCQR